MNAVTINMDNIAEYVALIPDEQFENLEREYYRAFGLHDGEKASAVCIYKILNLENAKRDTEAKLEFVNVEPSQRGTGLGKALMEELKRRGDAEGVKSTHFEIPKAGNEATVNFLKRAGFVIKEKEADVIRITMGDLLRSPISKKAPKPDIIGEIDTIPVRKLKSGIMNCIFSSRVDIEEDLPKLPVSWFDSQMSMYTMKDEKVTAIFLVHKKKEDLFEPVVLFALEPGANKDMLGMVRYSVEKALSTCPEGTTIIVNRRNKAVRKLVGGLFPWIKGEDAYRGEREEK